MTVPVQPQFDADGFRKAAKAAGYTDVEIEGEISKVLGPKKNIFQKLMEDDKRQDDIFKGAMLKSAANTLDRLDTGAKYIGEKTGLGSGGIFGKGRDFLLSKVPQVQTPVDQSRMDQYGDKIVQMGGTIAGELPAQLALTSVLRAPLKAAAAASNVPAFVKSLMTGSVPGSYFKSVAAASPLNMAESVALDYALHPENVATPMGVAKSAAQGLLGAVLEAKSTPIAPTAKDNTVLGNLLAGDREPPKVNFSLQQRQKLFDASAPFEQLGNPDLPNSAYNIARRLSGVNDQVHLVQNEQVMIPQRAGGYVPSNGPTMKAVVDAVGTDPKTIRDFDKYLLGKSGYSLAGDPAVIAKEVGDLEIQYPHFSQALDLYKKKTHDIADTYYGYGLIDDEVLNKWKTDGTLYVPTGRKMSNQFSVPNHMKEKTNTESMREIVSPMAQLYKLEQNLIRRGESNKLGQKMLEEIRVDPDKWKGAIEEVKPGPGMYDPVQKEMEVLADQFKSAGQSVPPLKELRALAEASAAELLDGSQGGLRVYENGQPVTLRIADPLFVDYFKSRQYVEPSAAMKVAKGLERGITRTVFQPVRELLGKNAAYDQFEAFLNTKWNEYIPGWDFAKGFYAQRGDLPGVNKLFGLKNDPKINMIRAERGGLATRFADPKGLENVNSWNDFVKNVDKDKIGSSIVLRNPLQALHELMGVMSSSTRYGAAMRKINQTGDAAAAANMSRNVLADPQQAGTGAVAKFLSNSAFANYQLQTIDRFRKALSENPTTVAVKGMMAVGVPSIGLWLANKDDQEIQDLRKSKGGENYWFVRNPKSQEIYAVGKPYLQGQLFGTAMETALDELEGTNPGAGVQLAKGLWQNTVPNYIPISAKLGIELATGQGFMNFPMDPIPLAPSSSQGALAEDVAGNNTLGISKYIAEGTGIQAAKVDRLLKTIMFSQAADIYDRLDRKMFDRIAPETKTGVLPAGIKTVNPNRSNVEPLNKFYEDFSKLSEFGKSMEMAQSQGNGARVQELLQKHPKTYGAWQAYDTMNEVFGMINQQIKMVSENKMMSPEERRRRVDDLKKMMITKARAWNQVMASQME